MIDLHAHLDLYPDPIAVIKEITERKMYVLSVTTTPSAWSGTNALAVNSPRIKTALGLHPQIVHERFSELALFDKLLPETKYVGEVGLDGGPEYAKYWNIQTQAFEHILKACSNAGGRIISIHSRRATSPVLDYLERYPNAGIPVLHWFSGTKTELKRAIDLGCWFSIGPAMLIAKRSIDLINQMPSTRLLTETDGPFAQVKKTAAMPWDVSIAIEQLADILNMSYIHTENLINNNFKQLLHANQR
ncbi:TatD family hydrolase [Acinetobacter bereziniae]|uniref:Qat anti-phage system TatD family nuclease QatD n=1 Tax=Acinetobacter bereziniae TaxID=106648 RepID=UPI0021CD72CD|nr:Qat anti-phage system TatD family nuclease QatD [Acinetobacter bereziniae]MCU4540068.1 TatD family hydrolase [Acinetobacter bereziniae]MCU4626117.1 TatD family hydrolase [Acinetobacter bereziniae]